MRIHNVHQRVIHAPADVVGPLLDGLGGDDDRLWPERWVPLRLDRPLQVGADGGHGPIRYHVVRHEPGRLVRFAFHPRVGIEGFHEATVDPDGPDRCVVRHVLEGRLHGRMRVLMPLVVRWLHDALLEDLLDNAERVIGTGPADPARWSPWVRLWRRFARPSPRRVALPEASRLLADALDRVDRADAWQVPLSRGASRDPQAWADAVFHRPPRWVVGLLLLRNLLVPLIGVERGGRTAFAEVARTDDEVLLGSDAGHLRFRVSVLAGPRAVTLSTVTAASNRRGRLYLALVWPFHPFVVRGMLRRASRSLEGSTSEVASTQA